MNNQSQQGQGQEEKVKRLTFKECFDKEAWKKHWKLWTFKSVLFTNLGLLLTFVIFIFVFIMITQLWAESIVLDYIPKNVERNNYFTDLVDFFQNEAPLQFFKDMFNTFLYDVWLYITPISIALFSLLFGLLFLYLNLRNFHEEKKKEKGHDNRVWIRDSRKMILTGDEMMIGKELKTQFTWDNKKERPSGIVIGSIFVDEKDYERLNKAQKMTPKVLENLKKQSKSENWKPLPEINAWAKKYNEEKKKITDGVKKDISRTDIINLKKQLIRDKFKSYDILNKELILKKKKKQLIKQIELVKNANSKNLKVKKSKKKAG